MENQKKLEEEKKLEEKKLEVKKLEKELERAYLLFHRGKCSLDLDDLQSARNDFTEAISFYKEPDFFYFRGLTNNKLKQYKNALLDFEIGIKEDHSNGEKYIAPMKIAKDNLKEATKEEEQSKIEGVKLKEDKKLTSKNNKKEDIKINKNSTKSSYPGIMICLFFISLFAPNLSLGLLLIVGIIGWLINELD